MPQEFIDSELNQSIPARFEQIVSRYPNHLALVSHSERWTYHRLNQQVNQIAYAILANSGHENRCVTFLMEYSPWMVITTLSILKAGKIYLAIHPKMPVIAQQDIVKDAQPELMVTTPNLKDKAIEITNGICPILVVDPLHTTELNYSDQNPNVSIHPDLLSTIFYTSGTTGQPKGVVKSHRTVLHRVWLCVQQDAIAHADRQSLLTYSSFASSEADIFGALLNGATLCLFDIVSEGLDKFYNWLEVEKITILHPPVLLFRRFLSMLEGENLFSSVRLVALAGENLLKTDIEKWQRYFSKNCEMRHRFSSTETGILTVAKIYHDTIISQDFIPNGFPVSDKLLSLIDELGQEVMPGEVGELIVKSAYIAQGYWSKSEATVTRLKPDLMDSNYRIYRTGDFGQFQVDGSFKYIGRRDHQFKIRGYRVNLREIESVLAQFPEILEAAVIAEQLYDEYQILAFLVWKPEFQLSLKDVRQRMNSILPDWKIPSRFITIDSLPITASGKIDRQGLLQILKNERTPQTLLSSDRLNPELSNHVIAPQNDIEQCLVEIWSIVLKLPQISTDENFLILGGHSLSAAQIIMEVNEKLQIELLPSAIFKHPNITELAIEIQRLQGSFPTSGKVQADKFLTSSHSSNDIFPTQSSPPLPASPLWQAVKAGVQRHHIAAISLTPRHQPLPLTFAQERLWRLHQMNPENTAHHLQVCLHLQGELNLTALEHSIREIICRHEVFRTTFPSVDGQPVQAIHPIAEFQLNVIDLRDLPDVEQSAAVDQWIRETRQQPFELTIASPWRIKLLRLTDHDHILIRCIHHIMFDGWSGSIFRQELAISYSAFIAGNSSPLPPLTIQYADFAAWQRQILNDKALSPLHQYWQQQLAAPIAPLELPLNHPRPTSPTHAGARTNVTFSPELTQAIKQLSHQEGISLFVTLLAAFNAVLFCYTRQTDLLICTPTANRQRPEVKKLIGYFNNVLPLRTDLSGNPSGRELRQRVSQVVLDAQNHQDMPLQAIANLPHLARIPLNRAMFALQNMPTHSFDLPGLEVTGWKTKQTVAVTDFELSLSMREHRGQLLGSLTYNTDLFTAEATPAVTATPIAQLLDHFRELLERWVADPDLALADLPIARVARMDGRSQQPVPFVAPRNTTEKRIADIWAHVLQLEQVGIHDNFFALGGHSLLATQVIARVAQAFCVRLSLVTLFKTPTIAELARQLAMPSQPSAQALAIVPVSRTGRLLLSFAQQRLWFLDQLTPNQTTYNIASASRLTGQLNITALERSLQEIAQRHESLRTNFGEQNGEPFLILSPEAHFSLPIISLNTLSTEEQNDTVNRLVQEEAQRPFNLATDSLWRVQLLQLSDSEHVLLITMHHIITDGWSMGIFKRELTALYSAFSLDHPSPLPPLPIQYADYASWQRQYLQGEILAKQLNYWKQQLGGDLPILEMPTDFSRPPVQTHRGAKQSLTLSSKLTTALHKLSQQQHSTLFMTLLAAFQTLLYRYSGQDDIIVGSPLAGRNRQEIEGLIGFFVNTLVLRTNLAGNPSFLELLDRVREMTLAAYDHQDLPLEKIIEELRLQRDRSRSPLFQVMFALQNTPKETLSFNGLKMTSVARKSQTAMFDLTLNLSQIGNEIKGSIEYNTDLFKDDTIARMIGHFQVLLEGIVSNPSQSIAELPLLTDSERHQILVEWNDTQADYPKDKCIHQLFEEQVERTPDAIAVVFEQQQLTYRELNQKANQLAHYLQNLGVKPNTLVGLCVERSLEMIVGLLGILKAGGAYVPFDPTYPQDRLAFMLADSAIPILLTQSNLRSSLPTQLRLFCLDADWEMMSDLPTNNSPLNTATDNLAYVIYTSGSTGQPKGVAMPHRSIVNLIHWQTTISQVKAADRTLQLTPLSFDVSVQEIFATWNSGGTLVLIPEETRRDPIALLQVLQTQTIARLFTPFILLQQLAETADRYRLNLPHLRELITAGEQLKMTPSLICWLDRLPHCKLQNHYGPTESHVVTSHTCGQGSEEALLPPIGTPIANTEIYVLDKNLQPVPIGVPGELHIAGISLAQGYLHRLDLTTEKFIENPFFHTALSPYSKLYKTGDLVRYQPDGNLEFLGRIDQQVKIRGFRIELGEIESVLAHHPQVEEVVVIDQDDQPRGKYLVAYIVPNQHQIFTPDELRQALKQKLPSHMIPTAFVPLEALPLTPNGKIDRQRLTSFSLPLVSFHTNLPHAVPVWLLPGIERGLFGPKNVTQEMLTQLWGEILKLHSSERGKTPLNIFSNFFEVGGHSLAASRLIHRIEDVFQIRLSLQHLFEYPTIFGLANCIEEEQKVEKPSTKSSSPFLVPLQIGGSCLPLFLVAGGSGDENTLMIYAKLIFLLGQEQTVYGLCNYKNQGGGWLSEQGFHPTVEALAEDYVKAIRTIQPEGPYLISGECVGGIVAFEVAQQLLGQGQSVERLVLLDTLHSKHNNSLKMALQEAPTPATITHTIEQALHQNNRGSFQQIVFAHQKAIIAAYQPKPYVGSMTLIVSKKSISTDPTLGWSPFVLGGMETYSVAGDHQSYLGQFVQSTAMQLRACLDAIHAKKKLGEAPQLSFTAQSLSSPQSSSTIDEDRWMNCSPDERLERLLKRALEIQPNHADFHLRLGRLWAAQGKWDAVLASAQQVIDLEPTRAESYVMKGNAFRSLKRWEDAIPCFQSALQLNPNQASIYVALGAAQQQVPLIDDAIASCQKAIALDSTQYWAYRILGSLLIRQGRKNQIVRAIRCLQQAILFMPETVNRPEHLSLIQKYLEQLKTVSASIVPIKGRSEPVIKPNQSLQSRIYQALGKAYQTLGNAQKQQGELEGAIASYQEALNYNPPQLFGIYRNLGDSCRQLGKQEEAIAAYQQACLLQPNNAAIHRALGNLQVDNGDVEGAIASYQQAIALNPQQPFRVYKTLGDLLSKEEAIAAAIFVYEKALRLQPQNQAVFQTLEQLSETITLTNDILS